jgi:hypothetical protein
MAQLLAFSTEDGEVLVAVRRPGEAVSPAGVADKAIQHVEESLTSVFSLVTAVAGSLHRALAGAPVAGAQAEFGVQFTGKGRLYVVEAGADAALTITLTLRPAEDDADRSR